MKKIILSTFILFASAIVWAQSPVRNEIVPAPGTSALTNKVSINDVNVPKTLACIDTLRYPQTKEQVVGTSNFYTFELWADDSESMSQAFLLSGSSLSVSGVEIYARRKPSSTTNLVVRASIYNVDGSNNPTTVIGFADITITDTLYSYRQINFGSALTVSNNYAVVIQPTSTGGIIEFYVNDAAPSQIIDEGLSKIKSSYYLSSNGSWVSVPVLTGGFTGGPYDFEMLAAAKVSYTINTNFATSPNPSCLGTPVNFGNSTTPVSVLSSRFYNYNQFRSYFQTIPDSTYAYDMDGVSPLVWGGSQTYTYSTAATHNPILYTLGGFWNSCLDNKTNPVTVNPLPVIAATPGSPAICTGSSISLTASGATSYSWSPSTGLSATTGATVTANPTATTTYTITGIDGNGCLNTSTVTVTVNPLPTVAATPSAPAICTGSSIAITASGASTYSWSPSTGLSATTGASVIANPTATTTYTITGVNGNGCSNTTQVTVTVNSLPSIAATASNPSFCVGGSTTLTATGGVTYSWSPSTGLSATTGANVTAAPTTTTTYTVTGIDANGCSNTSQVTVTVTPLDNATFTYPSNTICAGGPNVTPTVSVSGSFNATPAGLVFANATTGEIDVVGSSVNTYTVTYTTSGACPNSSTQTLTITTAPDASFSYASTSYCTSATNPTPSFVGSASAGTFSSTTGLVINSGTGEITLSSSTPGTYTVTNTIAASGSCPSASATATVTVNPLPAVTASASALTVCAGDPVTLTGGGASSYVWDNAVTDNVPFTPSTTTTYTVTGTDANNCSNTATLTVTVTTVDATTTTSNLTITANNATATYQWVDCNNSNLPIANETSQSYTATANGSYAVMVTENGCTEMSACTNIITVGLAQLDSEYNLTIYPNPVRENFTLISTSEFNGTVVKVISFTGQTLIETSINSGKAYSVNMSTFSPGLYFVEVNQNGELSRMKVMKQ